LHSLKPEIAALVRSKGCTSLLEAMREARNVSTHNDEVPGEIKQISYVKQINGSQKFGKKFSPKLCVVLIAVNPGIKQLNVQQIKGLVITSLEIIRASTTKTEMRALEKTIVRR
jgi:hypothetical protein